MNGLEKTILVFKDAVQPADARRSDFTSEKRVTFILSSDIKLTVTGKASEDTAVCAQVRDMKRQRQKCTFKISVIPLSAVNL